MSSWPDWKDAGRRIEMVTPEGATVQGTLYVADEFFTGEDEVPVFRVKTDDGQDLSFADHQSWRFI